MLLRCVLGKLPWSAKMKPHPGESWQEGAPQERKRSPYSLKTGLGIDSRARPRGEEACAWHVTSSASWRRAA